jgi:nitrogen fixation protein FixH
MTMGKAIPRPEPAGKFTGYHMLAIMIAFFGTVIAVNVTLAWYANSSWTGLVVRNSYVASQNFDATTAAMRAQAALGIAADIDFLDGMPVVDLAGKSGAPQRGARVELSLGRIADASKDRHMILKEETGGRYRAGSPMEPGLWVGELRVTLADGQVWRKPVRLLNGARP